MKSLLSLSEVTDALELTRLNLVLPCRALCLIVSMLDGPRVGPIIVYPTFLTDSSELPKRCGIDDEQPSAISILMETFRWTNELIICCSPWTEYSRKIEEMSGHKSMICCDLVHLRYSRQKQWGVYASCSIRKDTLLFAYTGELIRTNELRRRYRTCYDIEVVTFTLYYC